MIALADPESSMGERIEELVQIVSASRLNTFHTCRLKFFFRYVQELTKPMTAALFVGKAVHAALQAWSNRRWRGEPCDLDTLKPGFLENWATAQDEEPVRWQEDKEQDQQDKAWGLVELYLRETPVPAEEKPEAVEVTVEADLSQHGLPTLVGVIDLVRPGGSIVDFKTSSCAPQSRQILHRHETQLTGYSLLYREATGLMESGLELHHLVKTKMPKLMVSTFGPATETQKTRLFRSMESYVDGVQAEDFVPSPGLHCVSCEFFRECSVWKGGAA